MHTAATHRSVSGQGIRPGGLGHPMHFLLLKRWLAHRGLLLRRRVARLGPCTGR